MADYCRCIRGKTIFSKGFLDRKTVPGADGSPAFGVQVVDAKLKMLQVLVGLGHGDLKMGATKKTQKARRMGCMVQDFETKLLRRPTINWISLYSLVGNQWIDGRLMWGTSASACFLPMDCSYFEGWLLVGVPSTRARKTNHK